MTRPPKISVCIPAHNVEPYLRDTLESVLRQTEQDFEVIVYDDASTDATMDVVRSVGDDRIRMFRQSRNVGIARNRNSCLGVARGGYIAWLDGDDQYLAHALEQQAALLDANPSIGLVHATCEIIDHDGRRLPDWSPAYDQDVLLDSGRAFADLLLGNNVAAPTAVARRSAHDRAGPYRPRIGRSSTDWDMWLRIAATNGVGFTRAPLARYRQHDATVSHATERSGARLACDARVVRGVMRDCCDAVTPELRKKAAAALAAKGIRQAADALARGQRRLAMRSVLLAYRSAPQLLSVSGTLRLLSAIARGNEGAAHRSSRQALGPLIEVLAGSRLADSLGKVALEDPEWSRTLVRIADTVRRTVPPEAGVGVIDKWDPTVLDLSDRRGWHFPDLELSPDGYPPSSVEAIEHLEQLRARGMSHLVIPSSAFWWLEHYGAWKRHLDDHYERLVEDDRCVIIDLESRS